MKSRKRS